VLIGGDWCSAVAAVEGTGDGDYEIAALEVDGHGMFRRRGQRSERAALMAVLVAQIVQQSGPRIEAAVIDAAEESVQSAKAYRGGR
jgi:hypothetical protein